MDIVSIFTHNYEQSFLLKNQSFKMFYTQFTVPITMNTKNIILFIKETQKNEIYL